MEKRHERELKELSEKIKVMLKGAKKGSKAQIEAEAIQMQFDLKAKHREEMDELDEKGFFGQYLNPCKDFIVLITFYSCTRRDCCSSRRTRN
jgi:hypothetical protein